MSTIDAQIDDITSEIEDMLNEVDDMKLKPQEATSVKFISSELPPEIHNSSKNIGSYF